MTTSNYEPTLQEKRFLKYHERLVKELQHANLHFSLWKRLENYRADYLKELNQAHVFFRSTIEAHLEAALLHIFRVIDTHKDSVNIWTFLRFCDENQEIFSVEALSQHRTDIDEDKKKLETLRPITKNLKLWRNKAFAHIDEKFVQDEVDVVKQHPIEIGQVEETITTLFRILNRYLLAYGHPTWLIALPGEDDIQTVMDAIRLMIQEEENRIKKELEELSSKDDNQNRP